MTNKKCRLCNKKLEHLFCFVNRMGWVHIKCIESFVFHANTFSLITCKSCNKEFLVLKPARNETPIKWCLDCYQEKIEKCINCNRHNLKAEMYFRDDNTYWCNECFDSGHGIIRDYTYIPEKLNFYGANPLGDELFMGIELEVDAIKSNNYKLLRDIDKDYFYCKTDSSLRASGVEIVSHPMTFEYLHRYPEIIKDNLLALVEHGFESSSEYNCGLHIHLSKAAFGNYHLWKFLKFIYTKANREWLVAFSNRTRNSMDNYAKPSCYSSDNKKRAKKKNQGDLSRHHAVNLSKPNTVELRIFSGTLDKIKLWAYIEFTKALFDFTKLTSAKKLKISNFVTYVTDHKKTYKNLVKSLENSKKELTVNA